MTSRPATQPPADGPDPSRDGADSARDADRDGEQWRDPYGPDAADDDRPARYVGMPSQMPQRGRTLTDVLSPFAPVPTAGQPGLNEIAFPDPRFTQAFQHAGDRLAAVEEYAEHVGVSFDIFLDYLTPHLEAGTLVIEAVGGQLFVHTSPHGRPTPPGRVDVPANLWELLRRTCSADDAYVRWRVLRQMEKAGWRAEAKPHVVSYCQAPSDIPPPFGIWFGQTLLPVLVLPAITDLRDGAGPLTRYQAAGAAAVAIACDTATLDSYTTAVRDWMLSRHVPPNLTVVLLEAPSYDQPTWLRYSDASITPVTVNRRVHAADWPDLPPTPAR